MSHEKKHAFSFLHRWLCVVLLLAMLLTMAACDITDDSSEGKNGSSASTTEGTNSTSATGSTQSTPGGSDGTDESQTELLYELTQEDVDRFYTLLAECETLSIAGVDLDAIDAVSAELDSSFIFLDAQCSIATILHYSHTKDEALEQQYLDCVEICTQASDAYMQMVRRVYLSDTPAKDYLFADWTERDIADLLAYDERIAQLQQRNAEIGVEYRTTEDDERKIELYIEFVGNNNAIAEIYGYDNYYLYAHQSVYGRDYDFSAVGQLREYAQTYLADIYYTSMLNFYYSYSVELSNKDQRALEDFLYGDYNTQKIDYVSLYLEVLPESMGNAISTMLSRDSLFTNADDAMEGAFTTTIADRCYCFFGPGYGSSMTVIHEGGHYYSGQYANLMEIPLDLAETHSQGNEWLFISFLEDQLPEAQYKALVDYLLYENISMIMICLMVDEFEQIVYSMDLTGYTAKDFDTIMDTVSRQYFPDGDVEEMLGDMHSYWRLVVVEQPVYYISYAVSSIAAMSLYTEAEDDFESAMTSYLKLCQEFSAEDGFLGNILSAGLSGPFDEEFYKYLHKLIIDRS